MRRQGGTAVPATRQPDDGRGDREPDESGASTGSAERRAPASWWLTAYPVTALVSLYLLGTGRWGSYVSIPGAPVYVGDIGVVLAALQVGLAIAAHRVSVRPLARSPLILLMALTLVGYAAVRLSLDFEPSLLALRDAAPYGYAVVALLAFLLPVRSPGAWRRLVYLAVALHLIWSVLLRRLPGYPWDLPVLGTDAQIFVIRPDFDATVLGVGAAFALHDLLARHGTIRRTERVALITFIVASSLGMLSISTRAGLLAGLGAMAAACLAHWWHPGLGLRRASLLRSRRFLVIALVGSAVAFLMAVTPAGGRLLDGFENGSAAGTVSARQDVWSRVTTYAFVRPESAAIGVGFGRDFIAESGSAAALEGTYQNVRSPHNYIVGTLARLGVAGALMVSIIIGLGWWLAGSVLRRDPDPASVLAALLAISLPIVSLLGVVLESPFGAIPYFWALGQLAAHALAFPSTRAPKDLREAPGATGP